jgi:hypothetical protein
MTPTGDLLYSYLSKLNPVFELPKNVTVINPYLNKEAKSLLKQFCAAFYNSSQKRVLILGINPGRFGAGLTGIPFTDPYALEHFGGISNSFEKKRELSSRFVYDFINAYGGVEKFYNHFLLSSTCPLGFLKGIKNYNYYDSTELLNATENFISKSLINFSKMNVSNEVVISLGKKNAAHLEKINSELQLFGKIITLDHPRYILQYKRNELAGYLQQYVETLLQYS